MRRISMVSTAATAALVVMVLNYSAAAQQPDTRDRTIMTFSAPVELPGTRLEAGTYVFRLADTASRNIIQVLSEDEMKMLGQWLYVPAERQEATGDTMVTFRETGANSTPAVQFWYYPGEKTGKEFIYPKDQAVRIAQRTGVGVMTEEGRVDAQVAASQSTSPSSSTYEQPAEKPAEPAPTAAAAPPAPAPAERPAPVQDTAASAPVREAPSAVGTAGQQQPAPADRPELQGQTAARELPRTASPLALTTLLGLLSLAGAGGMRLFRQ